MPGWALALAITLAVEVPLVAALYPGQRLRLAGVAVLANAATNLTLNLGLPRVPTLAGRHVIPGEMLAVVAEAAAYAWTSRPRDLPRALFVSSLANAASFGVGLLPALRPWLRA